MTNRPGWWAQPFPPTGAITSEGIRNQLGRPAVDPLTTFVRETAQNSWDARRGDQPVSFSLELGTVSPQHRPHWQGLLTPPAAADAHLGLGKTLRSSVISILTVSDRGTKGLGGPTRADEPADGRRDWVSFVLNVGERRDTAQGGGTYGYGKAVLYRLSEVGTILVQTRLRSGLGYEYRLIGIALGESFEGPADREGDLRPFTGRHWWGDVREGHVEPLVGDNAEHVASLLGLPAFERDETGTSITVVAPNYGDLFTDDEEVAEHLASTVAWHLWPILLGERGNDRLIPKVDVGGVPVPVPDPAATYPLDMFVQAYRAQRGGAGIAVECMRPKRQLGLLGVERRFVLPMSEDNPSRAAVFADVPRDPHHVCLMRSPELVVTYWELPEPPNVHQAFAAVFRAGDDLDEVYAQAEPPTHDNWVADQLAGSDQTFVRTTFRRLREHLTPERAAPAQLTNSEPGAPTLGVASQVLGSIVAAAYAGREPAGRRDPVRSRNAPDHDRGDAPANTERGRADRSSDEQVARVCAVDEPSIVELDGRPVLVQRFVTSGPPVVALTAYLSVGLGSGGRENEPPAGSAVPIVLWWSTDTGRTYADRCEVAMGGEVQLVILPVPDTLTDIMVKATAVADES